MPYPHLVDALIRFLEKDRLPPPAIPVELGPGITVGMTTKKGALDGGQRIRTSEVRALGSRRRVTPDAGGVSGAGPPRGGPRHRR